MMAKRECSPKEAQRGRCVSGRWEKKPKSLRGGGKDPEGSCRELRVKVLSPKLLEVDVCSS